MTVPEVSIVMPVFNDPIFIKQAIKSILSQTFKNWELIIIDDASTDDTPNIVNRFRRLDNRIRSHKLNHNKGVSICLNKGIKISKGNFIARMDSDDIWLDKNKLKKQLAFMKKNKNYSLVGSWGIAINKSNEELFKLYYPSDDIEIRARLLRHNYFISSSVLIRKTMMDKISPYEVVSRYAEDYGLWLKLGTVGTLYNLPEYMTGYRINPKGISQNKYIQQIETSLRVIKLYKKDYPGYLSSSILWHIRKFYPNWLKGPLSTKIKEEVAKSINFLRLSR